MQHRTLVVCASVALLAFGIACSKNTETPASPSAAEPGSSAANPDGSTLKASAPTPQSPINNQQPDELVLVAGKSRATYADPNTPFSYEFEVRNAGATSAVCPANVVGGGSDSTVSYAPNCTLEPNQAYTWRVRAAMGNARGPWSSNATFRAAEGAYMRGNEIRDPLTNGRTVGEISGPTQFLPEGLQLLDFSSFVTYRLPQNLQSGELSMMILNADEGNPGDKSKLFSMQEGPDLFDITDDDYRMTVELRGRDYGQPGSVTFRIIPGDGEAKDSGRTVLNFDRGRWYFWRFTWTTGSARLEVKQDGPNGNLIHTVGACCWSHAYRPDPHFIHLGAPKGRASPLDATQPGIIIKNVWASPNPRPAFPGE
jgi:hypothetical protein